jgi:rare lipoprotein A
MIRLFVAATLGGLAVVLYAYFWLALTPVHAASCAGEPVIASYYGTESGSVTANGERFTGRDMTAAHRTLPFGSKLRVSYRGKSVVVRINDRGPFIKGRGLDLSKAAAQRIGLVPAGVGKVCVERL